MGLSKNKIVILGGGVTGLAVAEMLSRSLGDEVVVIEKDKALGGLARTLSQKGLKFDLGSHRLHKDYNKQALNYIKEVGVQSLLKRKRKGKLYFRGRFLDYPPFILNFISTFSFFEIVSFLFSYLHSLLSPPKGSKNFESAMIKTIGYKMYNAFYKEYAWKIWGVEPSTISVDGMRRRRTVIDWRALLRMLYGKTHNFIYPPKGIGQITDAIYEAAVKNGCIFLTDADICSVEVTANKVQSVKIRDSQGIEKTIPTKIVVSTIPIDGLFDLVFPKDKTQELSWRGTRLLYVFTKNYIAGESETYYFHSLDITFGRVSDISKYSPSLNSGLTGTLLTIEIPFSEGDLISRMSDEELLKLCRGDLIKAGILDKDNSIVEFFSIPISKVYPRYVLGWKDALLAMLSKLNEIENVFTIGRGGLFLHINIDHCLFQAIELSKFILNGNLKNNADWQREVNGFLTFCARD